MVRKEAEKIILPSLPDVVGFRGWKTSVIHVVVPASARPDPNTVLVWISESFSPTSTLDKLHDTPTTLIFLDGKLSTAIQYILNQAGARGKALWHQINMKMQEELERNTRLLGGRQALYMVAQSFVTADNTET